MDYFAVLEVSDSFACLVQVSDLFVWVPDINLTYLQ